jgi:hypothetical protein
MITLFHGFFAVLAGLLAVLFLAVGVADSLEGEYRTLAGGLLYTFIYGSVSLSAIRRIREAKKKFKEDLAAISSTLEAMPYDQAVSIAREKYVFFPHELALRKVRPTADEWMAFEWNTVQFMVERVGATAQTKVTFIP